MGGGPLAPLTRRRGLAATALALGTLVLVAVLFAAGVAATTTAALIIAFGASVGLGYAIALARGGASAPVAVAPRHETRPPSRTPSGSGPAIPSDLRTSAQRLLADVDEQRRARSLARILDDVRDAMRCDRVTLWRAEDVGLPLRPEMISGPAVQRFDDRMVSLIVWAADSRLTVSAADARPAIVAAPIGTGTIVVGILSLEYDDGIPVSADEAKEWAERLAGHLALLFELFEARAEYNRQRRYSQAMLRAAHKIQSKTTIEELGGAICETALEVTSAARSALVSWSALDERGVVESVSPGHHLKRGSLVTSRSMVGQACGSGMPAIKDDARHLAAETPVYSPDERRGPLGSLAIMPLKHGADDAVLGAVVLEGDAPGEVAAPEVRNVGLLAAIAATSLRVAWDFEETMRRAHTDQLTGLNNRRHFDEQLHRLLAESDRFGHPTSLLLCDIDHFKRINDSYGHDAGDAVLRHVAAIFMEQVRAVDICARYGGEEMAVLLPQTAWQGAAELAERLRASLEKRPARFAGSEISLTASFGVASYPELARSREVLFPAADRALYQAKNAGRNCVKVADLSVGKSTG